MRECMCVFRRFCNKFNVYQDDFFRVCLLPILCAKEWTWQSLLCIHTSITEHTFSFLYMENCVYVYNIYEKDDDSYCNSICNFATYVYALLLKGPQGLCERVGDLRVYVPRCESPEQFCRLLLYEGQQRKSVFLKEKKKNILKNKKSFFLSLLK